MIRFPTALAACRAPVFRAGGTDLMERLGHVGESEIVDLRDVAGLSEIADLPQGLHIGARVTVAAVARDNRVTTGWSLLAKAAGALATPEIRAVATVGGNLAQHTRCSYYRHPDFLCLKRGGDACFARTGDAVLHAYFDRSPCVSVHASTLAVALLCYDTVVEVATISQEGNVSYTLRSMLEVLGDGTQASAHNGLGLGELITSLVLPPSIAERCAYERVISRARAEWPLVEVGVCLRTEGARVAVGGVAGVPLRLPMVEAAVDAGDTPEQAAALAVSGASPLAATAYKGTLLVAAVRSALEAAW